MDIRTKVQVPKDRQFVGFDAYKNVLASDIHMVILATPPGFRLLHFEKAIEAGKHVFMEKPVAVDAPGIRRVLRAGELAKQKGPAVAVGLQKRHERAYRETVAELQNRIIGDLIHTRVYWNGGGVWIRSREEGETELRYLMKDWYYFNWLCGDHIVEQHIHNLDVANWLINDYPVKAQGMGGRQVRTGKDTGQIFDHHAVEFTAPKAMQISVKDKSLTTRAKRSSNAKKATASVAVISRSHRLGYWKPRKEKEKRNGSVVHHRTIEVH